MFGYSPDYSQGQLDQQFREGVARRKQQRQDDSQLSQWQRYAQELEARLASAEEELKQSIAETKAARVQRNVQTNKRIETQAALRQANPQHPLCNEEAVAADTRREIDQTLAQDGIRVDRNGTLMTIVRTR